MNMPQFKVVEGGKPKPKGKTGQALNELKGLLKLASADGKIDDSELRAIMTWRSNYRTVLRREPIKPFDDWLEEALADGQIDEKERGEMVAWADRLGEPSPAAETKPEIKPPVAVRRKTGDEYLAIPPSRRPSWKNDPATDKQVSFLLDLGESERACRGLTKGQASARISELLDEGRESRRDDRDGDDEEPTRSMFQVSLGNIVFAIVAILIVAYFMMKK